MTSLHRAIAKSPISPAHARVNWYSLVDTFAVPIIHARGNGMFNIASEQTGERNKGGREGEGGVTVTA